MSGRRAAVAVSALAAVFAGVPAAAFGQAAVGSGSAASEYGDYVPTTSGSGTSTPKLTATKPHRATRAAPTRHYTPPVRHYVAPARPVTPAPAAPRTVAPVAPAPVHRAAKHRARKHRPHHAAAVHRTQAAKPVAAKPHDTSVPAAPASSVDGGSGQLLLLGLAMLTMTVAVFARVGLRRRHGSV